MQALESKEENTSSSEVKVTAKQREDQALRFMQELGRGLPDDQRVMAAFAENANELPDENGEVKNRGFWAKPWKTGKGIPNDKNSFVVISASAAREPDADWKDKFWRSKSTFGSGLALMVDDIGTGAGSKGGMSLEDLKAKLPPTVIIETSKNNHQCWYFFSAPVTNRDQYEAFLGAFAKHALDKGGDKTIKDITRFGRLPVGINNKRLEDGSLKYGAVFQVRQVFADYDRRYTMAAIEGAFGFKTVVRKKASTVEVTESSDTNAILLARAVEICSKLGWGEGGGEMAMKSPGKYRMNCPWGEEHTGGVKSGAYIWGPDYREGEQPYVFGCSHDGCQKAVPRRGWSLFMDLFVLPVIENELEAANEEWAELEPNWEMEPARNDWTFDRSVTRAFARIASALSRVTTARPASNAL
ncbi:DNA-primase RepB domain-containing protein, partial [Caballeronia sp. M23-90]